LYKSSIKRGKTQTCFANKVYTANGITRGKKELQFHIIFWWQQVQKSIQSLIYNIYRDIYHHIFASEFKKILSLAFRIHKMKINLPDKLYYSIGEVAKAFDVNTSLIRYWEQEFPIIKPKKNKKGNRYFTPEDIKNLQMIYHLVKEKGYTLDGARIALTTNSKISETVTIIDRLEFIKAELQKLKASLADRDSE
jgi:DNA-binding transcriptional MerR regulator